MKVRDLKLQERTFCRSKVINNISEFMPGYVWTLSKVQRCLQLQFYYSLFAPLQVAKSQDATERPRYQTPA